MQREQLRMRQAVNCRSRALTATDRLPAPRPGLRRLRRLCLRLKVWDASVSKRTHGHEQVAGVWWRGVQGAH